MTVRQVLTVKCGSYKRISLFIYFSFMNASFKKVMAGVTAVTIVAMNGASFVANAAPINGATAVANGSNLIGQTITVTSTGNFPDGDEIATATIRQLDGTAAGTTTLTVGGDNADNDTSVVTIATANLTNNLAYIIFFRTTSGDFGSTTVNVGTPTNNNVVVSATVTPILSMALSNTTVDLGVLSAASVTSSTTDTTVTVATNANGGYVVSAAASNFVGATSANVIPFVTRAAQVAGTEGFSLDVASVGQGTVGTSTIAATNGLAGASTYAVANGAASIAGAVAGNAGTTDGDTFVVNYAASISPVTEADSYSTTVTYTVSGTF